MSKTHGDSPNHCFCCGRKLNLGKMVALELNVNTNEFSSIGWDEKDSQGWFNFGPACAKKIDVERKKA